MIAAGTPLKLSMGNDASKAGGGAGRPRGGTGTGTPDGAVRPPPKPPGLTMKVVLRGSRRAGKTSLFRRLKGEPFVPEYSPTRGVDVASISWTYKAADDRITIELWDVADKGDATSVADDAAADDASVYSGAHAVVLLFDPRSSASWAYARRALPRIPADLSVMVLANFRDALEDGPRSVTLREAQAEVDALLQHRATGGRAPGGSGATARRVLVFETSLANCFGLKTLYNAFNVPYLELKVASVLAELKLAGDEVAVYAAAQDYVQFMAQSTPRPVSDSAGAASGGGGNSRTGAGRLDDGDDGGEVVPAEEKKKKKKAKGKTARGKAVRDSDGDDDIAGFAPKVPPARAALAASGKSGGKADAPKSIEDVVVGDVRGLDSFLGDDSDDDAPVSASAGRNRAAARGAPKKSGAPPPASSSEEEDASSDSDATPPQAPPRKPAAPAKGAAPTKAPAAVTATADARQPAKAPQAVAAATAADAPRQPPPAKAPTVAHATPVAPPVPPPPPAAARRDELDDLAPPTAGPVASFFDDDDDEDAGNSAAPMFASAPPASKAPFQVTYTPAAPPPSVPAPYDESVPPPLPPDGPEDKDAALEAFLPSTRPAASATESDEEFVPPPGRAAALFDDDADDEPPPSKPPQATLSWTLTAAPAPASLPAATGGPRAGGGGVSAAVLAAIAAAAAAQAEDVPVPEDGGDAGEGGGFSFSQSADKPAKKKKGKKKAAADTA